MYRVFVTLFLVACATSGIAQVVIDPQFRRWQFEGENFTVAAGKWQAYYLDAGRKGKIRIVASIQNNMFGGGIMLLCGARDFRRFEAGKPHNCIGQATNGNHFDFSAQAPGAGRYHLVLDNRRSTLVQKRFVVNAEVPDLLTSEQVSLVRSTLETVDAFVQYTFQDADFDFRTQKCGRSNAFSNIRTGDITICTEFLREAAEHQSTGMMIGTIMHELGHTMMNIWGLPNYANEESADAFATFMLLETGQQGMIEEYVESYERLDSRADAEAIIKHGDTHPISVQRARNIRNNASNGKAFTSRWHDLVYPHLTTAALRSIADDPREYSSPSLARNLLREREANR